MVAVATASEAGDTAGDDNDKVTLCFGPLASLLLNLVCFVWTSLIHVRFVFTVRSLHSFIKGLTLFFSRLNFSDIVWFLSGAGCLCPCPDFRDNRFQELKTIITDLVAMEKKDKLECAIGLVRAAYDIIRLAYCCYPTLACLR